MNKGNLDKVVVKPTRNSFGIHAKQDFKKNDKVMVVPKAEIITMDQVTQDKNVKIVLDKKVNEQLISEKKDLFALFLMSQSVDKDTRYTDYLYSLPEAPLKNLPLFYTNEENAMLKGTDLPPIQKVLSDNIFKDFETLRAVVPGWAETNFESLYQKFVHLHAIVSSKFVMLNINGEETPALVPFVDIMEYREGAQTTCRFD